MDRAYLKDLLDSVRSGGTTVDEALERLRDLPFEQLDFATIDHHRALRQGFPEVIFGSGKTSEQIVAIAQKLLARSSNILITRTDASTFSLIRDLDSSATFHEICGAISIKRAQTDEGRGTVAVVTAGTSDIPVAEEAAVTLDIMGNRVSRLYDVGVAGIHRVLTQRDILQNARVIVCVAGMEGALPSVVGGLVSVPVIAVPTSIGYGASFKGVAALLGMLNSCASNVSVVNIDNGFGAGFVASLINRK